MAVRRTAVRRSGGGAGQAVTVLVVLALLAGLAWFGWDRMKKFKEKSAEVPTGPRVTLEAWQQDHSLKGTVPNPLPDPWRLSLETSWRYRRMGEDERPGAWVEVQFEGGRFTAVQVATYRHSDRASPLGLLDEAGFAGAEGAELRRAVARLAEKPGRNSVEGSSANFDVFAWIDPDGTGLRSSLVCAARRGAPEAAKLIARARAEWAAGTAAGGTPEGPRTRFDVVLAEVGKNREAVLAAVCEIAGLGPDAGATLVDSAPKPIKLNASKEEAEAIRRKLEAAGAKVEVK